MSKYRLDFTEDAGRDLNRIKKYYARRIVKRIEATLLYGAEDVTRIGVRKLRGFETLYRLRVGDYRVFYQVKSEEVTLLRVLSKQEEAEFYKEAKSYEGDPHI